MNKIAVVVLILLATNARSQTGEIGSTGIDTVGRAASNDLLRRTYNENFRQLAIGGLSSVYDTVARENAATALIRTSPAKVLYVSSSFSGIFPPYYSAIQTAINASTAGDLVAVATGVYNETITLKDSVNLLGLGNTQIIDQSTTGNTLTDNFATVRCDITNIVFRATRPKIAAVFSFSSSIIRCFNVTVISDSGTAVQINAGPDVEGIKAKGKRGIWNLAGTIRHSRGEGSSNEGILNQTGATAYSSFGTSTGGAGFYNQDSCKAYDCDGESSYNGNGAFYNQGWAEDCRGASTGQTGFINNSKTALLTLGKFARAVNCVGTARGTSGPSNVGFVNGSSLSSPPYDSAYAYNCKGYAIGGGAGGDPGGEGYNAYNHSYNEKCSGYSNSRGGYESYGSINVECSGVTTVKSTPSTNVFGMSAFNASVFGGADIGSTLINCNAYSPFSYALLVQGNRNRIIGGTFTCDYDTSYFGVSIVSSIGSAIAGSSSDSTTIIGVTAIVKDTLNTSIYLGGTKNFTYDIKANSPTHIAGETPASMHTVTGVIAPSYGVKELNISPNKPTDAGRPGDVRSTDDGYYIRKSSEWIRMLGETWVSLDDLGTLKLWLDPKQTVGISTTPPSDGDSTFRWLNLGTADDTLYNAIPGHPTTYHSDVVNGQSFVRFDSLSFMFTSHVEPIKLNDFSLYVVLHNTRGMSMIVGDSVGTKYIQLDSTGGLHIKTYDGSNTGASSVFTTDQTGTYLVEVIRSGSTITFYENGHLLGTGTFSGEFQLYALGTGSSTITQKLKGDMGTLLAYNDNHVDSVRYLVEAELLTKYRLDNIDIGNKRITGSLNVGKSFSGSASMRDTSAFTTTATRKAVYISGATSADFYQVTWRNADGTTVPTSDGAPYVYAKTDSLIVIRPTGSTSGLSFNWWRVK